MENNGSGKKAANLGDFRAEWGDVETAWMCGKEDL